MNLKLQHRTCAFGETNDVAQGTFCKSDTFLNELPQVRIWIQRSLSCLSNLLFSCWTRIGNRRLVLVLVLPLVLLLSVWDGKLIYLCLRHLMQIQRPLFSIHKSKKLWKPDCIWWQNLAWTNISYLQFLLMLFHVTPHMIYCRNINVFDYEVFTVTF